jgi:hypothetical protein
MDPSQPASLELADQAAGRRAGGRGAVGAADWLPRDSPPWMREGRGYVRVYADDVVEPADGPAEQCAYRRG